MRLVRILGQYENDGRKPAGMPQHKTFVRNPRGIAKTEIAALILPSISLVDERPTARVIAEA